jgi:hypothetical protein
MYVMRAALRDRFAEAHHKLEIPKDANDRNIRWRAQEAAKGGRAATFGNNMIERYTDVKAAIESLLPEAL